MSSELDSPNTAESSGTEPTSDHPWRYGCPYGHSAWYRTADGQLFCRACQKRFERLHDKKIQGTAIPPGGGEE